MCDYDVCGVCVTDVVCVCVCASLPLLYACISSSMHIIIQMYVARLCKLNYFFKSNISLLFFNCIIMLYMLQMACHTTGVCWQLHYFICLALCGVGSRGS